VRTLADRSVAVLASSVDPFKKEAGMSGLSSWKKVLLLCAFCAAMAIGSPAQNFGTLVSFNGTNGALPDSPLVQGIDGNLYGTTSNGGGYGYGTVFEITAGGALTTLYSFCAQNLPCPDGYGPGGLVLAFDGNFYGTTAGGRAATGGGASSGRGTVFKITAGGSLTTLHSFGGTDGSVPSAPLVQPPGGGVFYGTTNEGGTSEYCTRPLGVGCGTVFKITAAGQLTTLHNFCAQTGCSDGYGPSGLVLALDGNFYGTTSNGGGYGYGTVFKITAAGNLTTLHTFDRSDGAIPNGMVQAPGGNFFGPAEDGGIYGHGTVFEITAAGQLTTLYSFCVQNTLPCPDGSSPFGLLQATNGIFYGTTGSGGSSSACGVGGCGTIFQVLKVGTLTTSHNFHSTDGDFPRAGLVQATNGFFYGTTAYGGTSANCSGGCGTVFRLGMALGPFVQTLPTSGPVGTHVTILGNDLTGTTSVTFNGTLATFTVVSSTEIRATVPGGSITGKVKVTTPHGTLTSNVNFRVT
jgi:uncharacterized repeat protein (TIGR03803 family)